MNQGSIKLLAKWAINKGCHVYNDPDLELLLMLDGVQKKVYEENRIKAPGGFTEAAILAFEAVVRKVIENEKNVSIQDLSGDDLIDALRGRDGKFWNEPENEII